MEQLGWILWILLGILLGAGVVAGIGYRLLPKMVARRTSTFEETYKKEPPSNMNLRQKNPA